MSYSGVIKSYQLVTSVLHFIIIYLFFMINTGAVLPWSPTIFAWSIISTQHALQLTLWYIIWLYELICILLLRRMPSFPNVLPIMMQCYFVYYSRTVEWEKKNESNPSTLFVLFTFIGIVLCVVFFFVISYKEQVLILPLLQAE